MSGSPKKKRPALASKPGVRLIAAAQYAALALLQGRRSAIRLCVSRDSRITNRNLGGNNGRSALTGDLYCLRCADFPLQLLLSLDETR
jgi:hypothetical protein